MFPPTRSGRQPASRAMHASLAIKHIIIISRYILTLYIPGVPGVPRLSQRPPDRFMSTARLHADAAACDAAVARAIFAAEAATRSITRDKVGRGEVPNFGAPLPTTGTLYS